MNKSLYRLPMLVVAVVAVAACVSIASAKDNWDEKAAKAKAEYIYYEAQNAYHIEDYDSYVQLVRRAYELDSSNVEIAGEWGVVSLMDPNTDSMSYEKAYRALRDRFLADKSNFYNGRFFANVASQLRRFDDVEATWILLDSLFPTRTEPLEELAKSYLGAFANGDSTAFDKAIAVYDTMESRTGKTLGSTSMKIKAYAMREDSAAIVRELQVLDSLRPNDSFVALYSGMYYEYIDNKDKALEMYNKACELDSTNGSAYAARADYYINNGDSVAYDREVFHALRSPNLEVPNKVEILRSYVVQFFNDPAQSKRIRELFNTLQDMHPGEAPIHNLYGMYLVSNDETAEAAEQFSYATALAPENEEYLTSYIRMALISGDTIQALKSLDMAQERFATNLYYPLLKSYTYLNMGDTANVIATLDSVKIKDVKNVAAVANFLSSKGDIMAALGDTVRSLEIYDEALALDPNNNMALNNAAYFITLSGGDLDKAERYSMRSLKGDELNPTYLDTYAWVLFNKKQYSMAKMYIDMALNAYPEISDEVIEAVDTVAIEPIDADSVMAVEAEDVEKISSDVLDHAGDIYFMNGEIDKALGFWEKALALDPDNAIIRRKVENRTIFFK